jgi:hypothetical protein
MPAREVMPETPAMRYHDFGLLVTLAGPMAEECLWGGGNRMERAAVHEAGHCVMAWRLDHGIAAVVIRSDGSGLATLAPRDVGTSEAVALHSSAACSYQRESSDGRQAVAVAQMLRWPDRKAAKDLVRVRRHEARLRVNSDAALIKAVAGELLRTGSLTGNEVEKVIHETLRAQWVRQLEQRRNERNVYE